MVIAVPVTLGQHQGMLEGKQVLEPDRPGYESTLLLTD